MSSVTSNHTYYYSKNTLDQTSHRNFFDFYKYKIKASAASRYVCRHLFTSRAIKLEAPPERMKET